MAKVNNKYDENIQNIMFKAAQKLGIKNLTDRDIKRTIAECKTGNIDLGIDKV